jgi:hypothetical protein
MKTTYSSDLETKNDEDVGILQRSVAATKLPESQSTPGPAHAEPPPPAGLARLRRGQKARPRAPSVSSAFFVLPPAATGVLASPWSYRLNRGQKARFPSSLLRKQESKALAACVVMQAHADWTPAFAGVTGRTRVTGR